MATQDIFSGEEAKARLNQLPPDIRALIYSADMTNIIRGIGAAHGLHIDQIGNLESETAFLMLGFTDQKDFPEVLARRMPVDLSLARELAVEVHDRLLVKIRESLHAMYPGAIDPVTGSGVAAAPAPSGKPAIHSELASPAAEQPVPNTPRTLPTVAPAPTASAFASVDAALRAKQISTSTQVRTAPLQSAEYKNDPYLEPIE